MNALKIASIAAVLVSLGLLPAVACDYSKQSSNVTASATPAAAAEVQAAVPASPPVAATTTEVPAPATQTAETNAASPAQPNSTDAALGWQHMK